MKKNQQMKKFICTIAILMVSFTVLGQNQSGSFITIAGGVGGGGFQYVPQGINSKGINKDKLGWNAKLGYSYYFTPKWGLFTGVGMSYYRTIGKFDTEFSKNEFYSLGKQTDDDWVKGAPTKFELRVRLANWEEEQKSYFIEVPLMLMFKHKFGETEKHGFYFGLGAKLQFPIIKSTYRALDGDNTTDLRLNVAGRYDDDPTLEIGSPGNPNLSQHGFGSIHNPSNLGWNGDLSLKMSIAGTAELGFLFGLHPRVDLLVGGYFDYGFNNIKKGDNKAFLEPPAQYHPNANEGPNGEVNVGRGIVYNGMINTDRTEKVNLMAYGGRIGLQIKLGKIEEKAKPTPLPDWMFEEDDDDDLELLQKQLEEMRRLMQELLLLMEEEEEEEEEEMIAVQGTVLDAQTKEPLAAVVELIDARTKKLVSIIRADENGKFKFPLPEFGRYLLEAHKEGYMYASEEFMIPRSDERQTVDKTLYMNKIQVNQEIILKNIFFDTGKSTLKPESMPEIERVYRLMSENPSMEIEISGHTDNVGSAETNKRLSAARAKVVVQELVKRGISPDRMTSAGYGFDKPIAPNTTPAGRAENRRTEFKVTKM